MDDVIGALEHLMRGLVGDLQKQRNEGYLDGRLERSQVILNVALALKTAREAMAIPATVAAITSGYVAPATWPIHGGTSHPLDPPYRVTCSSTS